MKYEQPNMEILLLLEQDILTTSPGLRPEENGGNSGGDWSDWFE